MQKVFVIPTPEQEACTSTDSAHWIPARTTTIYYWIRKGQEISQNMGESDDYPQSQRRYNPTEGKPNGHYRFLKKRMFYTKRSNGEIHLRR